MGEAKQRKMAKAAGRPWARDAPPPPKPVPWYMDPNAEPPPAPRERLPILAAEDPVADSSHLDRIRNHAKVLVVGNDPLLVVGNDPRALPVRRRRSSTEVAAIIAALSMGGLADGRTREGR